MKIPGTRIKHQLILDKIKAGDTIEDILDAYPHLTRQQVEEVISAPKINKQLKFK